MSFLLDAVREVRKYSGKEVGTDAKLQPNMFDHLHMKLFRAQRNLYISGFAVFLWLWVFSLLYWQCDDKKRSIIHENQLVAGIDWFLTRGISPAPFFYCCFCRVMKRVVTLINQLATLSSTTAALQAQADSANQTAKKYMEDNEMLKQVGSSYCC